MFYECPNSAPLCRALMVVSVLFALCLPSLAGQYVLSSRSGGSDLSGGYGLNKSASGYGASVTIKTEYVFTFTWMGDNAADLPPQNVVMTRTTSAKADIYGNPGSGNVDSNLGDTAAIVVQGSSSSASVDGSKTTVESGGPTITARATPTATSKVDSLTAVNASTRFNASVSPVVITVSGTIKDSNKNDCVLIGQNCSATISSATSGYS